MGEVYHKNNKLMKELNIRSSDKIKLKFSYLFKTYFWIHKCLLN